MLINTGNERNAVISKVVNEQKVSVVIPCYNAEPFVAEAISSVLNQTWPWVELVVVDDGSSDGSWKEIKSFGDKITALHQTNSGGCSARNNGFKAATGDFIMFMDADDLLGPDSLSHLVEVLVGKPGIAGCSWLRLENDGGEWTKKPSGLSSRPPKNDFLLGWLSGWYIPPCALMWSRQAFEAVGGWDEGLAANQDGDLIMRALLAGTPITLTDFGEAYYRHHGVAQLSVSSNLGSVSAFTSRVKVFEKVAAIVDGNAMWKCYSVPLGQAFHKLARNNFVTDPGLARLCVERSYDLAGKKAVVGSILHRTLCYLLGVERKETLATALGEMNFRNSRRKKSNQLRKLNDEAENS